MPLGQLLRVIPREDTLAITNRQLFLRNLMAGDQKSLPGRAIQKVPLGWGAEGDFLSTLARELGAEYDNVVEIRLGLFRVRRFVLAEDAARGEDGADCADYDAWWGKGEVACVVLFGC